MVGLGKAIISILIMCWSALFCSMPAHASTPNRAKDVHFVQSQDGASLFLLMDGPPAYSVRLSSPDTVKLLIPNCQVGPRVVERVISGTPGLTVGSTGEGGAFFSLRLKQGIEEIKQAWVKEGKILHLKFLYKKEAPTEADTKRHQTNLRRIRFGLRKGFTRVVLDLDGRPNWLLRVSPKWLIKVCMEETKYKNQLRLTKLKRIKKIWLEEQGGGLWLSIQPAYSYLNSSVIWLDKGNRLVVDVYETRPNLDKRSAQLPPDFGAPTPVEVAKKAPESDSLEQEQQLEAVAGGPPLSKRALPATQNEKKNQIIPSHQPQSQKAPKPEPLKFKEPKPNSKKLTQDQALLYGRIVAAKDLREFREGIVLIGEFLSSYPNSPVAEELTFLRADFYMGLFEQEGTVGYQTVVEAYQQAVDKYPGSSRVPEVYLKMARATRMGGDYYAAMSFINLLLEKYSSENLLPAIYLERAYNYKGINLPDKAFEDFKRIVQKFPQSPQVYEARMGVAAYLHQRGLYQEAEQWLAKLSDENPVFPLEHPQYYLLRAKNYIYLKKFQRARELFFQALNMTDAGESPDLILTRIADTYWYEGRTPEAKSVYTYVAAHHPSSEGASIAQLRLAEITSGVEAFKELHEKYRDRPIGELALLKLANLYYKNKDYRGVLECLKELVLRPADDQTERAARTLFRRAAEAAIREAVGQGEHQEVVDLFESYREFLKEELAPETQLLLAQSYLALGRYEEGLKVLEGLPASDLPPAKRPDYHFARARCLKGTGKVREALDLLEKYGRQSASSPKIRARMEMFLADLYWEMAKKDQALTLYSGLVSKEELLAPSERKRLHFHLGKLLNTKLKPKQAREHLQKAMVLAKGGEEEDSTYGALMMELARSYRLEGKLEKAIGVLEQAIAKGLRPDNEFYWDVNYKLAEYYHSLGQEERAVSLYKRISEEGPSHLQLLVQLRLGSINLNRQLKQLQYWSELDGNKKIR